MYIKSLHIKNVRCFEDITLNFKFRETLQDDPRLNWNVILGDNGDGKTTLLQAIAACLTDSATAGRLLDIGLWVRKSHPSACMRADFVCGESPPDIPPKEFISEFAIQHIVINGGEKIILSSDGSEKYFRSPAVLEPMPDYRNEFENYEKLVSDFRYFNTYFADRWTGCGYGPFRRVLRGSEYAGNAGRLEESFQTLFDEGATLGDCELWLKELQRRAFLDGSYRNVCDSILGFLKDILPGIDRITIEKEVEFLRQGHPVSSDELSHGYRSMFALTADLLRQIVGFGDGCSDIRPGAVSSRGLVLIDEIDAHLHPVWQREVGFLLTKIFPNIQFVVTSHSPFVAMTAGSGAVTMLEKRGNTVAAQEIPRIRDWTVDRVLTDIFGVGEYSLDTEKELREYDALRLRQQEDRLEKDEENRLARLEADLDKRLSGDKNSPVRKSLDADLAYLKSLINTRKK